MSIDDNTNESEHQNSAEAVAEAPAEAATPAATNESVAAAQQAASNLVATLLALKDSNPKVFFGGVGAVVLVLLMLFMSGGSDGTLPARQAKSLAPGQSYVLKNPNSYDPAATIRLVAVPGSMQAYDDTEENDREGACKHMPQNTPVKLVQTQVDTADKKVLWVEIEILAAGECMGKKAWTSAINLQ